MAGTNGNTPKATPLTSIVKTTVPPLEIFGEVYPCQKLDWDGWLVVQRMNTNDASPAEIFETANRVLNSAPVVKKLGLDEACGVLLHAAKAVELVVENAPPNSAGEATASEAVASPSSV